MTKRARGGSNWWEEDKPVIQDPAAYAREHMPETAMPYNLQTVVFKRCAYLEDVIEQKKRAGLKFNFYASELEGIVWLLRAAGITYERQAHHGMDPEKLAPEPEPERPTAMAIALAKEAENKENAREFLEAACKVKVSYTSKDAAERAIVRIRENEPDFQAQHAYACVICNGFHLTSYDPERSDLAKKIIESRRRERPLPMDNQAEIVAAYRGGQSIDEIAETFKFPRRAICNTLNDAGFAVAVATDAHRRMGLDR